MTSHLVASCSILLALSFAAHDAQLDHTHGVGHRHYHASEDAPQIPVVTEYLHATDKKSLFLVALVALTLAATTINIGAPRILKCAPMRAHARRLRCDEHIELFRRGILNPKIYRSRCQ